MPISSEFPISEHCSDLSEQMNALGLPLSFNSSKRMINGSSKSKKKSNRVANVPHQSHTHDFPEAGHIDQKSNSSLCISNTMQQNDEILADASISTAQSTISDGVLEDNTNTVSSKPCSVDAQTTDEPQQNIFGQFIGKFCSWEAYWDFDYMKVYYHNAETDESTWYPPPEIKSPVYTKAVDTPIESNIPLLTKDIVASTRAVDLGNLGRILELHETQNPETVTLSLSYSHVQERAGCSYKHVTDTYSAKQQKKNPNARRRLRRRRMKTSVEIYGEPEETADKCSLDITKYWCQRYMLFSRFDEGIKMDEEGWFSATPEAIAAHHAVRCAGGGCIVDPFAGVGGNSIQFACRGSHVIAVDIDPKKTEYARHNAAVYGCADRIDFIQGDFFVLADGMKADKVFLSPPWGGPDYADEEAYDLDMLRPYSGRVLFDRAKGVAPMVVMFLPRTTKVYQLAELAASDTPPWNLEVEMNYLNGKVKAITAYFSKGSEMGE